MEKGAATHLHGGWSREITTHSPSLFTPSTSKFISMAELSREFQIASLSCDLEMFLTLPGLLVESKNFQKQLKLAKSEISLVGLSRVLIF